MRDRSTENFVPYHTNEYVFPSLHPSLPPSPPRSSPLSLYNSVRPSLPPSFPPSPPPSLLPSLRSLPRYPPSKKVVGIIDASHIAVPPPSSAHREKYLNFEHFHSVILMAVVDNRGFFRWLSCDSPGSRRDNVIFRKTQLFRTLQEDQVLPRSERTLLADGACILGDTAFAENSWMRTPIPSPSTRREKFFNHKHADQRAIANFAFGRLKWKF